MKQFNASDLSKQPSNVWKAAREGGAIIHHKNRKGDVVEEFVINVKHESAKKGALTRKDITEMYREAKVEAGEVTETASKKYSVAIRENENLRYKIRRLQDLLAVHFKVKGLNYTKVGELIGSSPERARNYVNRVIREIKRGDL